MQDPAEIGRRKRRSNRAVLAGVCLMATALLLSSADFGLQLATTGGAIGGFALLMYGVHVGWLVFYDRDPQDPAS